MKNVSSLENRLEKALAWYKEQIEPGNEGTFESALTFMKKFLPLYLEASQSDNDKLASFADYLYASVMLAICGNFNDIESCDAFGQAAMVAHHLAGLSRNKITGKHVDDENKVSENGMRHERSDVIIVNEDNIAQYGTLVDIDRVREERKDKCSSCGGYVAQEEKAPWGLCGACNEKDGVDIREGF